MPTKSQNEASNIGSLLRARNNLIYVVTPEEARVERYLFEACASAGYTAVTWDCSQGVRNMDGSVSDLIAKVVDPATGNEVPNTDLTAALVAVAKNAGLDISPYETAPAAQRRVWIMRDLPAWTPDNPLGIETKRRLRNLGRALSGVPRERAQAIVVITPVADLPADLQGQATVVDWPRPDREEIASILDTLVTQYNIKLNGAREAAIDAAVGLTGEEASNCYARSLVQTKTIDPGIVSQEKKRIIQKSGVLQWLEPIEGGLKAVGGLDGIKSWVGKRALALFSPKAAAYGLQTLKGILLAGISGCGKTYVAMALGAEWRCPVVKFDFGALKGKFVGQSEGNLRKALDTLDSLGLCIVVVDEIEKALAGATQGAADGGVSADALGTFLSWMNDRRSKAFVIATANDITSIVNNAPELLRKGRFDEIFWVDLPTAVERVQVLEATLRKHKRTVAGVESLVDATEGFSGAELASLVPEALFTAFADGERDLTVADLAEVAKQVVPLSVTAKEKIASMRAWAATRAKSATTPDAPAAADKPVPVRAPALDLE